MPLNYRVVNLDFAVAGARVQLVEPGVGISAISVRGMTDLGVLRLRYGQNGQASSVEKFDAIAFPQLLTDGLFADWPAQGGKVAELYVNISPIQRL